MFREELNQYLSQLNCSGRELARRAGLSEATVSRYRDGGDSFFPPCPWQRQGRNFYVPFCSGGASLPKNRNKFCR